MFLLLVIYTFGVFWETILPKRHVVEGTRLEWLGPTLHLINPGNFKLKEVRFLYQFQRVCHQCFVAQFPACHCHYNSLECFRGQHVRPQLCCAASECCILTYLTTHDTMYLPFLALLRHKSSRIDRRTCNVFNCCIRLRHRRSPPASYCVSE